MIPALKSIIFNFDFVWHTSQPSLALSYGVNFLFIISNWRNSNPSQTTARNFPEAEWAQVVEHLPSKYKTPSSNSSTSKNEKLSIISICWKYDNTKINKFFKKKMRPRVGYERQDPLYILLQVFIEYMLTGAERKLLSPNSHNFLWEHPKRSWDRAGRIAQW
jgi:hypothetical protein